MGWRNFEVRSESDLLHLHSLFGGDSQVVEDSEEWAIADLHDTLPGPLAAFTVTGPAGDEEHSTHFFVVAEPETAHNLRQSNEKGQEEAFERSAWLLFEAQFPAHWLDEWADQRDRFMPLVDERAPVWQAINAWGEGLIAEFNPEGVRQIHEIWLRLCEILEIDEASDLSDCSYFDDLLVEWHRYRKL